MRRLLTLIPRSHWVLLARLLFGLYVLMTSFYCLLAYIPFTYQWVVNCTLITWLPTFVKAHPYVYWVVLAGVAATIAPSITLPKTRRLTIGFIAFHIIAGAALLVRPLLSNLSNDDRSFVWSLASLFPLVWLAAIDYASQGKDGWAEADNREHLSLSTVLSSSAFLTLLYMALFYFRFFARGAVELRQSELIVAVFWTLASHLCLFVILFVVLKLTRALSDRFKNPVRAEFLICNLLVALAGFLVVRTLVLSSLSFNNNLANLFSVIFSFSATAFLSGLSLKLTRTRAVKAPGGLALTMLPILMLMPRRKTSWFVRAAWAVGLALAACLVPLNVAMMDWDFLIQKLSVIAVWVIAFSFFYSQTAKLDIKRLSVAALLTLGVVSLGAYKVFELSRFHLPALLNDSQLDVNLAVEGYADYDLSFKIARGILEPNLKLFNSASAQADGGETGALEDGSFYAFLQQNTNLPPSMKINPVEIKLVERLTPGRSKPPHIFIFVIDSLRQDYVSAYNNAVTFTPAIDSFARESVVLKNSFTRYDGTAFSEPSIWVGGMQVHKQYVEPFYPMNSLQKLVEAERYESFITIDPVLEIILKPDPEVVELDKGSDWVEYDLCRTLEELQEGIDAKRHSGRPLFCYSQAQNLHIVMRNHKKRTSPPGEEYPGFDAFYASQVKHIDSCFGQFINYLKARNLYDDSIIVLTADHGDSLGEGGRWGHGSFIFPELARIPLIIHLPSRLQKSLYYNADAAAFLTDITPSLYYLLGHRPIIRDTVLGRPLFTLSQKEHDEYVQQSYLLGSSYGAVYGLIKDNGRSLFISDGTNHKDYFYDLASDPRGLRNRVNDAMRAENQKLIRDHLSAINRFYKTGESR
jgi:hypothetical protein